MTLPTPPSTPLTSRSRRKPSGSVLSTNSVKRATPLSIQSMGYCPSSKVSQKAQNISAAYTR